MSDPESSTEPRDTEELLFQVRKHYARTYSIEYDARPDADRVQEENETFTLEKEIFRRESAIGFPLIRDFCNSPEVEDRMAALMILYRGTYHGPDLATLLLPRLEAEEDPEVLMHLILWFRYQQTDDRAVPSICKSRDHPDHMVRTCVADALGAYLGNPEASTVLSALLHDVHENVREAAMEELQSDKRSDIDATRVGP